MKHQESRTVGALCLILTVLFFALGDYLLAVPLLVYGVLCFVIPHRLFASRERLEAARKRRRGAKQTAALIPWYQSPVIVGIIIASIIFGYYAFA